MTSDERSPRPVEDEGHITSNTKSSSWASSPTFKAALSYGKRQWPVIPLCWIVGGRGSCGKSDCSSPGKHPLTPNGVHDATTHPGTIVRWWKQWPKANIGIATGNASRLVVLDVDGPDGEDSLDKLIVEHGPLLDTVEATTGKGRHMYFLAPEGTSIKNLVGHWPGVDIRGDGGYVVAPPSRHQNGREYTWEFSSHPDDVPLSGMPAWLIDELTRPEVANGSEVVPGPSLVERVMAGIKEGERDKELFRYACRLRGFDLTWEEADLLMVQVAHKCDPPFSASDARQKLKSAWKYEPGEARLEAEEPGEYFTIVHGDEIENLPEPEWLIEDFLTQGSLGLLYGGSGVGKTFIVEDMGGCIAAGLEWHGRPVHQGNVVYVAAEGVGDLGLRVEAFRVAHDLDTLPAVSYVLEPVNLFTGDANLLAEQIADLDPVLIIIDTLARSMAGGDENMAKDINAVIASADRLRHKTGATVLIVHHSGHDKKRERGSSALKAAADTVIKASGGVPKVTLKCDKMKTAKAFDPIVIELAPVTRSLAALPGTVTPDLDPQHLACARLVPTEGISHGDWKKAFVGAELGAERTFDRYREHLEEHGIVEKREKMRGTRYYLTQRGQEKVNVTGAK